MSHPTGWAFGGWKAPRDKTPDTHAISANIQAVREQAKGDPTTREVSVDTKAKGAEGEYARRGKNADGSGRDGGEGMGP